MAEPTEFDPQDQAELFDEDNTDDVDVGPNQHEMRTFEEMPDVLDVTTRLGDGREDRVLDASEFTDDAIDDEELAFDFAHDGEIRPDADGGSGDPVTTAGDEVELSFQPDVDNLKGAQSSAAHFESRGELSDSDVEDLGYGTGEED